MAKNMKKRKCEISLKTRLFSYLGKAKGAIIVLSNGCAKNGTKVLPGLSDSNTPKKGHFLRNSVKNEALGIGFLPIPAPYRVGEVVSKIKNYAKGVGIGKNPMPNMGIFGLKSVIHLLNQ
jgi:hypothetical protein